MLVMENSEEVLQILERFTKLKQKDIPKELEDYLCYVAKTGDTVYNWMNIKYLFREKLIHVIKDFHDTTSSVDDLPQYPNVDPFNYETMKSALLERLEMFNAAPFTVQRLCELLTDPRKQYSRIDKFMRALEKNILVVSTIEPGRKQPESENGDSLDSVVNGDLSLDVNVDIDMESESIFSMEPHSIAASAAPSSSYTKPDEDSSSVPKKPKLEINDDNIETKTKSDSESDEASDDSDSSDSKEIAKEESDIHKNKLETDQVHTNLIEKTNDNKENTELKTSDETETTIKINDSVVQTSEKTILETEKNSKKLNNDHESQSTLPLNTETRDVIETLVESVLNKPDESKIQSDESVLLEKNSEIDDSNSQSVKPDSTDPCLEEVENSDSVKLETNKLQHSINYKEDPNPAIENQVQGHEDTHDTELILKDNSSISLTYSQSNEASSSSQTQKNSEQMSVEDASSSSSVLLPQLPQNQTLSTIVSTTSNVESESQIPDQPMDENVEVCSTVNSADSSGLDEVVMQSESDMATDTIGIKVSDDKIDLGGMDVDDISQEEAMDQ